MTHSKCLVTAEQNAAYAALMPQTSSIQVFCGLQGVELCQLVLKASTLQELVDAVSREINIPGDCFRLLWGGAGLGAGRLPMPLLRKSDIPVKVTLVRINPAWAAALDRVVASLVPELPSIACICDGPALDLSGEVRTCFAENRDLALAAVQYSGSFLMHFPEDLLHDKELVSTALRECGSALRFVPVPLRRDREVVLVAVQNDGEALFYAPPELQADAEVAGAAVAQVGQAMRHASTLLKQDRAFVFEAARRRANTFLYAHERLRQDKAFVMPIVRVNGDVLTHVPQALRSDRDVCMAARAYWAGEGDAPPSAQGLVRQGLLLEPSERAKLAAQAVREGRPT